MKKVWQYVVASVFYCPGDDILIALDDIFSEIVEQGGSIGSVGIF